MNEDLYSCLKIGLTGLRLLYNDVGKKFFAFRNWLDKSKRADYLEEIKVFLEKVIQ